MRFTVSMTMLASVGLLAICGCGATRTEARADDGEPTLAQMREWNEESLRRSRGLLAEENRIALAGGLEMGTAGYHVTRPWTLSYRTAQALPKFPDRCSGDWCFWDTKPRYEREYWASDEPDRTPFHVIASYRAMPLNGVMVIDVVREGDDDATTYSVIGHLGQHGIERLRGFVEPLSTEHFGVPSAQETVDWFGVLCLGPQPPMEMRLLLVADDRAYCSFSVQDVLANVDATGATSASVLLADGLPRGEADELAKRLSRSR